MSESPFLTYNGTFGDKLSGKLDTEAGSVNVSLEGRGSSKLQSSFGRLKKQELNVTKLLKDSKDRWAVIFSRERRLRGGRARLRTRLSTFQANGHAARAGAAAEKARRRAGVGEGEDPHHKLLLHHPHQKGSMHRPRSAQAPGHAGQLRQGASRTLLSKVALH